MDQLKSLLLSVAVLFGVALKAGIAIGATGTVVEAFGLFLQRFSNSKVRAVGSFFEQLGKKLEAIGTDIPKLVGSARVWYGKIASLFGVPLVFFLVVTLLSSATLVGCSAAQSRADAQLAVITAGCKVSLDLETTEGAAGAYSATEQGCRAAIETWKSVDAPASAGAGGSK